jgi:hypothetical protein
MSKFTDRIDRTFVYTPSGKTDIRKTFAAERRRLAKIAEQKRLNEAEAEAKVATIKRTIK